MEEYDYIVDPIREVRHRISARFGHDSKRLIEHYMERQKHYDEKKLIRREEDEKNQAPAKQTAP